MLRQVWIKTSETPSNKASFKSLLQSDVWGPQVAGLGCDESVPCSSKTIYEGKDIAFIDEIYIMTLD